jgi:hypothetical protein
MLLFCTYFSTALPGIPFREGIVVFLKGGDEKYKIQSAFA